MKKLSFVVVALTAVVLFAGDVRAQGLSVTVKIPFSFLVRSQLIPAGEDVLQQTAPDVLLIHGDRGSKLASFVLVRAETESPSARGKPMLTFTKDETQWRLASVDEPWAGENFVVEGVTVHN